MHSDKFLMFDRILDELGTHFNKKKFGKRIFRSTKREKRDYRLSNDNCYRDYQWFDNDNFAINYGLGWFLDDEKTPFVYLDFFMDKDNAEELAGTIEKNLDKAESFYKRSPNFSVGYKKSLDKFPKDSSQRIEIVKYLKCCIDKAASGFKR